MLNIDICIKCYEQAWGHKQPQYRHLNVMKNSSVWCEELQQIIFMDRIVPKTCPYELEHVMTVGNNAE
jgi:hypothetical protein